MHDDGDVRTTPVKPAAAAEAPDRHTPLLPTIDADPSYVEPMRAETRSITRRERELVRTEIDAIQAQADAPKPDASATSTADELHKMQQMRRVDELEAERRAGRVRPWDGAERAGTVVAAAVDGVIVHIGRDEYVHVPARHADSDRTELIGRHVSVDRAGTLREAPVSDLAGLGHERTNERER